MSLSPTIDGLLVSNRVIMPTSATVELPVTPPKRVLTSGGPESIGHPAAGVQPGRRSGATRAADLGKVTGTVSSAIRASRRAARDLGSTEFAGAVGDVWG